MLARTQISLILASAGLALPTLATPRTWNNAAGGAAATSTNWNPNGVPVAADVLNYTLGGSYSVSFNSLVPTTAQQNFSGGTVSLSASFPHVVTGQFVAGLSGAATVSLTNGQISSGGTVAVASGGSATLTVTGPASSLLATNAAAILRVGNGNLVNGTVNVLNGGLVQATGAVVAGAFGNSTGNILVSGVSGLTPSRLETTDAAAGDITLGAAGNATMTVTSGGEVACADDFSIAPNAGFTASLSVGSGLGASIMDAEGDLRIGSNTTAAAAGDGTLTLNTAAVVSSAETFVGDPNGGSGLLRIVGNSSITTGSLTVDPVNGTLQHDAGQIRVLGGVCSLATPGLTLNAALASETAVMNIESGATLTLGSIATVGSSRQGRLLIVGGGSVVTPGVGTGLTIGQASGAVGLVEVFGGGRFANPGGTLLLVGLNGTGTLDIGINGIVEGNSCNVGSQTGGSGTVIVDGTNARLNLINNLFVGGSSGGAGGTGSLTIANGGAVTAGGDVVVYSSSDPFTMNGGTLTAGGDIEINGGTRTLTNVSITANTISLQNPTLNVSGSLSGEVSMTSSVTTINATGPLTMGDAASTVGVFGFGTVNAGTHAVTLLDSNNAVPGNVTIAGGSLSTSDGLLVRAGDQVSGFGTVNGPVSNLGTISPSGAGLTFTGLVSGTGLAFAGSTTTFATGGGFFGSGAISTQVITQAGSQITASGAMSLGDSTLPTDKAEIGGAILGGPFTVQLFDSVRPLVTGSFELQGGILSAFPAASGVQFKRIGVQPALLSGNGSAGVIVHNNGRVNPGSLADRTRVIAFSAGYDQRPLAGSSAGTYEVDIDGATSNNVDRLAVTGTAFLDGTLIVNRVGGFMPPVGQQYTILNATTVSGTFPVVLAEGFQVVYSPTTVTLVFQGICDSADFNCDEDFGTDADIESFFACLGGNCPACPNDSDFNNDGDFGTDADIEAFFRVLGGGACN